MHLHLHAWGDAEAPPVVCLHGVGGHGARFRRLAEEHLDTFRVLAPDLRGHGHSGWEPPWTLATHVADLLETLAAAGVDRAAAVGHSFGGRLALELTAAGLVERAALLDPAVWIPPPVALERAEQATEEISFASLEEAIPHRVLVASLAPREILEEELREHLLRGEDGRFRYRFARGAVVTALAELAQPPPDWDRVRVPTLLVHGADSDVVPEIVVDVLRDELGELLDVVRVTGGHNVLWDAYDATAAAIASFL